MIYQRSVSERFPYSLWGNRRYIGTIEREGKVRDIYICPDLDNFKNSTITLAHANGFNRLTVKDLEDRKLIGSSEDMDFVVTCIRKYINLK